VKALLIDRLARRYGQPKRIVELLLKEFLESVTAEVVEEGRFHWPGFGVFKLRFRKERRILNPMSKEPMVLPRHKTIGFHPGKRLSKRLNGP